jgi:hypothetical protein
LSVEVFGRLRHPGEIELAVLNRLRERFGHYLTEIRAQHELGPVQAPRSWGIASEFANHKKLPLPAIVIVSSGTIDEPQKLDSPYYGALYSVSVICEVSAAKPAPTRKLAHTYGMAIRGVLLGDRDLGDGIEVAAWTGEELGTIDVEQDRTRVGQEQAFAIWMDDIASVQGPQDFPAPLGFPEVETTEIEVERHAE